MSAVLQLRSLICNEPATSFGDDIEIFVDGISVAGQFPIDQGQWRALGYKSDAFEGSITVDFKEDSDPAGSCEISENDKSHKMEIKIKDDGRYDLYYRVRKL